MKLRWLSRFGIVITAFGLPITTAVLASWQFNIDQNARTAARDVCLELAKKDFSKYGACWDQWSANPMEGGYYWQSGLEIAALLFAVGWVLALAIYWSVRWVLAGRQRREG